MAKLQNIAFIDAQNLTQNTRNAEQPWKVDLVKLRTFLTEKYKVDKVYYFIGVKIEKNENLYKFLEHVGYEVVFREHDSKLKGIKKTNVDTDIVFYMMNHAYRKKDCDKLILISNDGDYARMVKQLIDDEKFYAIMFPGKNSSSLYRKINNKLVVKLYSVYNRKKLELKK